MPSSRYSRPIYIGPEDVCLFESVTSYLIKVQKYQRRQPKRRDHTKLNSTKVLEFSFQYFYSRNMN